MDFYPKSGLTDEELEIIENIEALPLNPDFDTLTHADDHLIVREVKYTCDKTLSLRGKNLSDQLVDIFGDTDHSVKMLSLDQTVMPGQHLAKLTTEIDGYEFQFTVINDTATFSFISNADYKEVTRACSPQIIRELLAGIIYSIASDPNSVRLRPALLQNRTAEDIKELARGLAQLYGEYSSRVVSKFDTNDSMAMFTILEETEAPTKMGIVTDLNIGIATPPFTDIIDANHLSKLQLTPADEATNKITSTIGTLGVSLEDYITVKEIGLGQRQDLRTIDKDLHSGEWADLCGKLWGVVGPLLESSR